MLNSPLKPLQTVVSIPGHLLLNAQTLNKRYPARILPHKSSKISTKGIRLTSIQLLSLHLYRWRRGVPDPHFDAYINTLPNTFFEHPLTAVTPGKLDRFVLDLMPVSVAHMLLDVERRLKDDWDVIIKIFVSCIDSR
jgi:hypothetical protein